MPTSKIYRPFHHYIKPSFYTPRFTMPSQPNFSLPVQTTTTPISNNNNNNNNTSNAATIQYYTTYTAIYTTFFQDYSLTSNSGYELGNFSLVYGIIALAVFIIILLVCTFSILCYFRCIAKSQLQQNRQTNGRRQRIRNVFDNNAFQMNIRGIVDLNETTNDTESISSISNKPPVYENCINFASLDKLPTYNSYKETKARHMPTAESCVNSNVDASANNESQLNNTIPSDEPV